MRLLLGISNLLADVTSTLGSMHFGGDRAREQTSPTGEYILKTISHFVDHEHNNNQWWYANFQVLDTKGTILFDDKIEFSTWFPLQTEWTSANEIVIRSGNAGNFIIQQVDGKWVKNRKEK